MQDSPHFRAQGLPLPILIGGGSFRGCSKGGKGLCLFAAQPAAPLTAKSPALSRCNKGAGVYNGHSTHLALAGDAPAGRPISPKPSLEAKLLSRSYADREHLRMAFTGPTLHKNAPTC